MTIRPGDSALASRLKKEIKGEVLFDAATRGRYSTDASIYQIEPIGVVIPQTEEDAVTAMQIGIDAGVAVLPRGGGTSQCGQTVGEALVIDVSKYLRNVTDFNAEARTCVVQPGMVLTVEPGCYIRPGEGVPAHFENIGIRIEDDLLVTDGGYENLTAAAPKSVSAIESLMCE